MPIKRTHSTIRIAPPVEADIFPAALSGLSDAKRAEICQILLAYGVAPQDLPRYIADLLSVIETVFDAYVAEKRGKLHAP